MKYKIVQNELEKLSVFIRKHWYSKWIDLKKYKFKTLYTDNPLSFPWAFDTKEQASKAIVKFSEAYIKEQEQLKKRGVVETGTIEEKAFLEKL